MIPNMLLRHTMHSRHRSFRSLTHLSGLAVAVAALVALAGCAVGPDYHRPDVPNAERFLGQHDVEQRRAANRADLEVWWEGFGDPQLTRFVRLALDQNLDLAVASARVTQAGAGLRFATAALLPSGAVSAQAAKQYQSVETPLGRVLNATPNFDRHGSLYEADLTASWEIDIFGGLRREREASQAEYKASEAGLAATRVKVAAQAADTYVTIRGLQARLSIARQQVDTQRKLVSTVRLLYAKGLAAALEAQQAEGALAQVEATIPELESGLDAALNAMDVLLGSPPGTYRAELADIKAIPVAPRIEATGTPADLLRRRPDLIVAERRLAATNARIGAAIAEYYPKVSLSGLLGSATTVASGNLFSAGANQAAGVAGLRWRLFDFGRIGAQIDQAKGREAEALADYRLAVLHASEDVENAFTALVKREEQTSALERGELALRQARNSSFAAYEKGVVRLIEVLLADENLLKTSDAKAQAEAQSARAAIAAFKALGGGWQATTAALAPGALSVTSR